jgi:hypothetical protein
MEGLASPQAAAAVWSGCRWVVSQGKKNHLRMPLAYLGACQEQVFRLERVARRRLQHVQDVSTYLDEPQQPMQLTGCLEYWMHPLGWRQAIWCYVSKTARWELMPLEESEGEDRLKVCRRDASAER